jgi:hypothetical protein
MGAAVSEPKPVKPTRSWWLDVLTYVLFFLAGMTYGCHYNTHKLVIEIHDGPTRPLRWEGPGALEEITCR